MEKNNLSVILPVYNEAGVIEGVVTLALKHLSCLAVDFEIIIVNDGSTDNVSEVLRKIPLLDGRIKTVSHKTNLGYGRALMSGVGVSKYPLIFFMDADGQFDISEIDKLICYVKDYSIITGYRYERKDNFYRIFLGNAYGLFVFLLFGLRLKDINCGFKLFRREVLEKETFSCSAGAFYTEILLKARKHGYKVKEVVIGHFPRLKGRESGANPSVIFNAFLDLIKLRFKRN